MNYDYASLGNSCQISSDCLLNNTKYFPPNFSLYNVYITKMTNYPAENYSDVCNKKELKKKAIVSPDVEEEEEDTKKAIVSPDVEENPEDKKKETFVTVKYSQSCCGRK